MYGIEDEEVSDIEKFKEAIAVINEIVKSDEKVNSLTGDITSIVDNEKLPQDDYTLRTIWKNRLIYWNIAIREDIEVVLPDDLTKEMVVERVCIIKSL